MARPGLTYTEVEAAARQLQAENKLPTVDAIRNLIKSGSDTTIARHLNSWKDRNSAEAQAGNIPLPLYSAVQGLWNILKEEAGAKISMYEAESTAKIEAIEKVLRRFEEQHKADQHEKNLLDASLVELKDKSSGLSALLQAEQEKKARLQEQMLGLERQCSQQLEEMARLHDIIKSTQANLMHFQAANLAQKETHSLERENERNEYLEATRALEAEIHKLAQEKALIAITLKNKDESLSNANQLLRDIQDNVKKLDQTVADSKIQNALLEQRNQELIKQIGTITHQHEMLSDKFSDEIEKTNMLSHENSRLILSVQKVEDQIHGIMSEKLFLIQEKSELLGQLKVFQQQKA